MTSLKILGGDFRKKREEMHLSLKEVENATSIRKAYLEAIENGNVEKFISSVYALGFIKQYGSFLGFDIEKIVKENPKIFMIPNNFKQEFDFGIGTLDVRSSNSAGGKLGSNIFKITISVIILIFTYFIAKAVGII